MKTLLELEALPELGKAPNQCMCCSKPLIYAASEIIVYRAPNGENVSFERARNDDSVKEIITAHVCLDCDIKLYKDR